MFGPGVVEVKAVSCSLRRPIRCLKESRIGWVKRRRWKLRCSSVLGPVSVLGVELVGNPAA